MSGLPVSFTTNQKNQMSHFTTIKTQIRDIDALRQATGEMGYTLIPNAEARGFINNTTKGDYVIRLKGPSGVTPPRIRQPRSYFVIWPLQVPRPSTFTRPFVKTYFDTAFPNATLPLSTISNPIAPSSNFTAT